MLCHGQKDITVVGSSIQMIIASSFANTARRTVSTLENTDRVSLI